MAGNPPLVPEARLEELQVALEAAIEETPSAELPPRLHIPGLVRACLNGEHIVINSDDDLRKAPATSPMGIVHSLLEDLKLAPRMLGNIALFHARRKIEQALDVTFEEVSPHEPAWLVGPGYFGPNGYMETIQAALPWKKITHPSFENLRPRGRIKRDANHYANLTRKRQAPTGALFHSRGGPIILNTLLQLQEEGQDDKLGAIILVSPISHGVRDEVTSFIRHIPSRTIREMCPGSDALTTWQRLSPENREKVVIILPQDGDQFVSKERARVSGGTLVLTRSRDGHLQQCLDEQCLTFKTVKIVGTEISRALEANYFNN